MAKKTTKTTDVNDSGKKQALDLAIAQITKQFGDCLLYTSDAADD